MKSAGKAIPKIRILSWLVMCLLMLCCWGVFAQEGEAPHAYSMPELPVDMKGNADKAMMMVDVLFLLDNSGSMIANDPHFITREVVTKFLKNSKAGFRVGMVIFDREATLVEPLSSLDSAAGTERFIKSLDRINYKGQFTNTPSGVERAIYELKSNGREDAEKIIILLTDGIVDTGNKEQDLAGEAWLKDQLTMDCKKAGIRVFGIAFTELADFRLIQTIALKTDGEYFRTFKSEDIPAVIEKIERIISTPKRVTPPREPVVKADPIPTEPVIVQQPASPPPPLPPTQPVNKAFNPLPLLLSGLILIVLLVVILVYLNKKREIAGRQAVRQETATVLASQEPPKGQAELIDAENVVTAADLSIPIEKKIVKIGRDDSNDIVIPKDSISSLHATIEYRNGYYYLEDHRSTNGTRLNNKNVRENTPMRLKSGDKIQFAIYEFRFLMPEMAPYGETVMIQSGTDPNLKK